MCTLLPLTAVIVSVIVAIMGTDRVGEKFNMLGDKLSIVGDQVADIVGGGSEVIDDVVFPGDVKFAGSRQALIGGGIRTKWGVKVYSVGFYGDQKLLKSLKKKSGEDLARDFSESRMARTFLLSFRRKVASSDVAEALGEALVDKVGIETSDKFKSFILDAIMKQGGDGFEKGSELYITCKGEKLSASLTADAADTIVIKGLCPAVFSVYLGSNPVSPSAKAGFEKGFAEL